MSASLEIARLRRELDQARDSIVLQTDAITQLRAEVEAKTDRLIAAEAMANSLANQIGSIEPHEHPDEQKPRAQTWLQERKNWAAEVAQLRAALAAALAAAQADKERIDWLADQNRRERESMSEKEWESGVTLIVFREHGEVEFVEADTFRAAVDQAREGKA